MTRFKDKVVIVTGAAQRKHLRSLGAAYVDAFLAAGCTAIVLVDVRKEALQLTASGLQRKYKDARIIAEVVDITIPDAVTAMMNRVVETFGRIDVLVNNAGILPDSLEETATKSAMYRRRVGPETVRILDLLTNEDWLKYWNVNVNGTFWCTREALKIMYEQRQGSIINIASIAAFGPAAGFSPGYAASKAAIIGMTKAMADEAARFGVRMNVFAPSAPDDGSWEKLPEDKIGVAKRSVPLGRLGTLNEYAKAVLFLADDGYMVGQVLSSNGGIHI